MTFLVVGGPGHGGPPNRKGNLGVVYGNTTLCPLDWVKVRYDAEGFPEPSSERAARRWAITGDIVESERTLAICLPWWALLEHEDGIDFRLSRHADIVAPLKARAEMTAAIGADFLIEVHVNSGGPKQHGADLFWKQGCKESRAYAELFAELLPDEMRAGRKNNVHEAKPRPDWTYRARNCLHRHGMPAIVCEVGYATFTKDREFILSAHGVDVISNYLAMATIAAAQLEIAA